ncbi:dynein intermediate chain 4, axonemal-like [Sebastes umbrosus]|uniref:dynein intermediate chain 4, axonemal-like n=1 Tax=Sebastes umbrosus TaxID=72105 RepID=UPI0018A0E15D|nr:dynein intermediate chain 4, axonemal-like [Sebastes umbrosus]
MRRNSWMPNSSSVTFNNAGSGQSQKRDSLTRRSSLLVGACNRRPSICNRRPSIRRKRSQAPRGVVRVLDDDGKDVTPLPLYHEEPGDVQPKPGCRMTLDEIFFGLGPDQSKLSSSANVVSFSSLMGSSRLPSQSTAGSWTVGTEDSISKLDMQIYLPASSMVQRKSLNVKQHVTEEMLDEEVDVCLTETDTISLLDIPSAFMPEDADDAEDILESNIQYAELCKSRIGSDKYVVRSTQTFKGAPKHKQTQTNKTFMVDEGTSASIWNIYDSFCDQSETPESEKAAGYPESTVNTSKGQEKRGQQSNSSDTISNSYTGSSISSQLEMEMCGESVNAESDLQLIMLSESFQHSLLVMERSILADIFQPKLAAYRQLPILEDPDSPVKPEAEEQSEESSSTPTLERLWAFSCELTRGCNITSMAWNKENQDLLAVSYDDCTSCNNKPGLICCWTLKNPTWPERVFNCHSRVTCLDFSASNPGQLAVGMYDGTVAIYNVQSRDNVTCIDSSECPIKHLLPVWQVSWAKQQLTLSEVSGEALVSVSEDGRICKWFFCSKGLECIDLMELKNCEKKATGLWRVTSFLSAPVTAGLCVDFHPTDSSIYLAGTREGPIHKCSVATNECYLATYKKHFRNVNDIKWSLFSPDVFLSCSSDWTIQLWKQDRFTPVLSFTSTQRAVHAVTWSPNWSAVFAAINGEQVEIWDLNSSILDPTIVHHAAVGVKVTSMLFATGTDCLLVGESDGQVTVYQLKNLNVGEGKQVDSLEEIVRSAM